MKHFLKKEEIFFLSGWIFIIVDKIFSNEMKLFLNGDERFIKWDENFWGNKNLNRKLDILKKRWKFFIGDKTFFYMNENILFSR